MIDSEFCIRCGRPYAMYDVWYCDSCIKDMLHEGRKALIDNFDETSHSHRMHKTSRAGQSITRKDTK